MDPGPRLAGGGGRFDDEPPTHWLFLTSASQQDLLARFRSTDEIVLPTGQVLADIAGNDECWGWPYMLFPLRFLGGPRELELPFFQLYPVNEIAREARRPRAAFAVVLHDSYRASYGVRRYVLLRNPDASIGVGGRPLELPLPLAFREQVPLGRAVIHETVLRALGMRPGELCELHPTSRRRAVVENSRLMRDRRMVARVRASDDVDVGYPVCRLEQRMLDVLGLAPGDDIVVNSRLLDVTTNAHWSDGTLSSIRVRALLDSGSESKAHDGGLALEPTIGADTLPRISLDLLRRQAVGVLPGEAVLLRPAFGSLLTKEFAVALNALALGGAGSLAARRPLLAVVCLTALLVLLGASFVRRFR